MDGADMNCGVGVRSHDGAGFIFDCLCRDLSMRFEWCLAEDVPQFRLIFIREKRGPG